MAAKDETTMGRAVKTSSERAQAIVYPMGRAVKTGSVRAQTLCHHLTCLLEVKETSVHDRVEIILIL